MNKISRELAISIQVDRIKHPKKTFRQIGNDFNIQPSTVSKAVKGYYNRRFDINIDTDVLPLVEERIDESKENNTTIDSSNNTIAINNNYNPIIKDNDDHNVKKDIEKHCDENTSYNYTGYDVDKLQELNLIQDLQCGLVDNRHSGIPTNVFVYRNISSEEMFDYAILYSRAKEFIKTHIEFDKNNVPNKDIILYATGLQCAIVAIIRACYHYKVNLYVMHYNSADKKYYKQVVFNNFHKEVKNIKCPNEFRNVIGVDCNKLYLYNSDINKFTDNDSIGYIVDKAMHTRIPTKDPDSLFNKTCIICESKEDALKCYKAMGSIIDSDNTDFYISLTIYKIKKNEKGKYTKIGTRIRRETNW